MDTSSRKQVSAMFYTPELGLRLKTDFPWIEESFRNGSSLSEIVKDERLSVIQASKKTKMKSLSLALGGYNGKVRMSSIKEYPGLMSKEDYYNTWMRHNRESTIRLNTIINHRNMGKLGALKRGKKLWSDEESKACYNLSLCGIYKKGTRIDLTSICEDINYKFHDGENIRTKDSIKKALKRYREQINQE
jgi:hypothetical protein